MIELTINQQQVTVPEGRSILDACREVDIPIPTLCYHPALQPYGACRLCLVEAAQAGRKPRLVAACTYPCENGLEVQTDSERIQRNRRLTAQLLLAGAFNVPEIAALAHELGVERVRYTQPEADDCILCGLCVRVCQEIVSVSAISLVRRGAAKHVAPPFEIASAECIGCGTCVLVCPTGAISLHDIRNGGPVQHGAALDCHWCAEEARLTR